MKSTVRRVVEETFDIARVRVKIPVRYEDEDIPYDFPFREKREDEHDLLTITYSPDDGQIEGWGDREKEWFDSTTHDCKNDDHIHLYMKVCDEGHYALFDHLGTLISVVDQDYVPHGVIPGEYGDYVVFNITRDGKITNLPDSLDLSGFFEQG